MRERAALAVLPVQPLADDRGQALPRRDRVPARRAAHPAVLLDARLPRRDGGHERRQDRTADGERHVQRPRERADGHPVARDHGGLEPRHRPHARPDLRHAAREGSARPRAHRLDARLAAAHRMERRTRRRRRRHVDRGRRFGADRRRRCHAHAEPRDDDRHDLGDRHSEGEPATSSSTRSHSSRATCIARPRCSRASGISTNRACSGSRRSRCRSSSTA